MGILKTFEEFGRHIPTPFKSPKINQFGQGTPNGASGTYEPKNKSVDPDDPIKVGLARFLRDFNGETDNTIIHGEKPKRRWRQRREKKRLLRLNSGVNEKKDFENVSKPKDLSKKMDGVSLGKGKNGKYFVYTHRARCKDYDSPEAISKKDVDFIKSTG